MLAVCVANRLNDLNAAPADLEVLKYSLGTWARFPLTLGKEYLVYGVSFRDSIPWYYVCDDNFTYYPALWSSLLFKLVDGTPSRFWRFNPGICSNDGLIVYPRLVLPNWAISDDLQMVMRSPLQNFGGSSNLWMLNSLSHLRANRIWHWKKTGCNVRPA